MKNTQRECRVCRQTKDIEDFAKQNTYKGGRGTICKKCDSARGKPGYVAPCGAKGAGHIEEFMSLVNVNTDRCLEWNRSPSSKLPYGRVTVNGSRGMAHRESYKLKKGIIPDGLCVLHKCDNPKCVNPRHLFIGTQLDNVRDMLSKGRGQYQTPKKGT